MVSDILYYAKDRVPNWEPLSAVDLANEVCGIAQAKANENSVQIDMAIDPDAGEFEADAQAVRSLLVNLIENSVDACRLDSKEDHHVSLRLKGLPDHIQYEVEDNGIGMDQETREKAFSLFFSSKGAEGTGLGLFISDRIAKSHGGFIELESTPGVGTRFVVNLPRVRPHDLELKDPQPTSKEVIHG
jgi:signal transduction histidine kinase